MISCSEHDYIEIACSYRYPIRLTLKSGDILEGIAKDTALNHDREECILIQLQDADRLLVLDEILKMEVTVDNPHFKLVLFKDG